MTRQEEEVLRAARELRSRINSRAGNGASVEVNIIVGKKDDYLIGERLMRAIFDLGKEER